MVLKKWEKMSKEEIHREKTLKLRIVVIVKKYCML
jgi:hypothetical protein